MVSSQYGILFLVLATVATVQTGLVIGAGTHIQKSSSSAVFGDLGSKVVHHKSSESKSACGTKTSSKSSTSSFSSSTGHDDVHSSEVSTETIHHSGLSPFHEKSFAPIIPVASYHVPLESYEYPYGENSHVLPASPELFHITSRGVTSPISADFGHPVEKVHPIESHHYLVSHKAMNFGKYPYVTNSIEPTIHHPTNFSNEFHHKIIDDHPKELIWPNIQHVYSNHLKLPMIEDNRHHLPHLEIHKHINPMPILNQGSRLTNRAFTDEPHRFQYLSPALYGNIETSYAPAIGEFRDIEPLALYHHLPNSHLETHDYKLFPHKIPFIHSVSHFNGFPSLSVKEIPSTGHFDWPSMLTQGKKTPLGTYDGGMPSPQSIRDSPSSPHNGYIPSQFIGRETFPVSHVHNIPSPSVYLDNRMPLDTDVDYMSSMLPNNGKQSFTDIHVPSSNFEGNTLHRPSESHPQDLSLSLPSNVVPLTHNDKPFFPEDKKTAQYINQPIYHVKDTPKLSGEKEMPSLIQLSPMKGIPALSNVDSKPLQFTDNVKLLFSPTNSKPSVVADKGLSSTSPEKSTDLLSGDKIAPSLDGTRPSLAPSIIQQKPLTEKYPLSQPDQVSSPSIIKETPSLSSTTYGIPSISNTENIHPDRLEESPLQDIRNPSGTSVNQSPSNTVDKEGLLPWPLQDHLPIYNERSTLTTYDDYTDSSPLSSYLGEGPSSIQKNEPQTYVNEITPFPSNVNLSPSSVNGGHLSLGSESRLQTPSYSKHPYHNAFPSTYIGTPIASNEVEMPVEFSSKGNIQLPNGSDMPMKLAVEPTLSSDTNKLLLSTPSKPESSLTDLNEAPSSVIPKPVPSMSFTGTIPSTSGGNKAPILKNEKNESPSPTSTFINWGSSTVGGETTYPLYYDEELSLLGEEEPFFPPSRMEPSQSKPETHSSSNVDKATLPLTNKGDISPAVSAGKPLTSALNEISLLPNTKGQVLPSNVVETPSIVNAAPSSRKDTEIPSIVSKEESLQSPITGKPPTIGASGTSSSLPADNLPPSSIDGVNNKQTVTPSISESTLPLLLKQVNESLSPNGMPSPVPSPEAGVAPQSVGNIPYSPLQATDTTLKMGPTSSSLTTEMPTGQKKLTIPPQESTKLSNKEIALPLPGAGIPSQPMLNGTQSPLPIADQPQTVVATKPIQTLLNKKETGPSAQTESLPPQSQISSTLLTKSIPSPTSGAEIPPQLTVTGPENQLPLPQLTSPSTTKQIYPLPKTSQFPLNEAHSPVIGAKEPPAFEERGATKTSAPKEGPKSEGSKSPHSHSEKSFPVTTKEISSSLYNAPGEQLLYSKVPQILGPTKTLVPQERTVSLAGVNILPSPSEVLSPSTTKEIPSLSRPGVPSQLNTNGAPSPLGDNNVPTTTGVKGATETLVPKESSIPLAEPKYLPSISEVSVQGTIKEVPSSLSGPKLASKSYMNGVAAVPPSAGNRDAFKTLAPEKSSSPLGEPKNLPSLSQVPSPGTTKEVSSSLFGPEVPSQLHINGSPSPLRDDNAPPTIGVNEAAKTSVPKEGPIPLAEPKNLPSTSELSLPKTLKKVSSSLLGSEMPSKLNMNGGPSHPRDTNVPPTTVDNGATKKLVSKEGPMLLSGNQPKNFPSLSEVPSPETTKDGPSLLPGPKVLTKLNKNGAHSPVLDGIITPSIGVKEALKTLAPEEQVTPLTGPKNQPLSQVSSPGTTQEVPLSLFGPQSPSKVNMNGGQAPLFFADIPPTTGVKGATETLVPKDEPTLSTEPKSVPSLPQVSLLASNKTVPSLSKSEKPVQMGNKGAQSPLTHGNRLPAVGATETSPQNEGPSMGSKSLPALSQVSSPVTTKIVPSSLTRPKMPSEVDVNQTHSPLPSNNGPLTEGVKGVNAPLNVNEIPTSFNGSKKRTLLPQRSFPIMNKDMASPLDEEPSQFIVSEDYSPLFDENVSPTLTETTTPLLSKQKSFTFVGPKMNPSLPKRFLPKEVKEKDLPFLEYDEPTQFVNEDYSSLPETNELPPSRDTVITKPLLSKKVPITLARTKTQPSLSPRSSPKVTEGSDLPLFVDDEPSQFVNEEYEPPFDTNEPPSSRDTEIIKPLPEEGQFTLPEPKTQPSISLKTSPKVAQGKQLPSFLDDEPSQFISNEEYSPSSDKNQVPTSRDTRITEPLLSKKAPFTLAGTKTQPSLSPRSSPKVSEGSDLPLFVDDEPSEFVNEEYSPLLEENAPTTSRDAGITKPSLPKNKSFTSAGPKTYSSLPKTSSPLVKKERDLPFLMDDEPSQFDMNEEPSLFPINEEHSPLLYTNLPPTSGDTRNNNPSVSRKRSTINSGPKNLPSMSQIPQITEENLSPKSGTGKPLPITRDGTPEDSKTRTPIPGSPLVLLNNGTSLISESPTTVNPPTAQSLSTNPQSNSSLKPKKIPSKSYPGKFYLIRETPKEPQVKQNSQARVPSQVISNMVVHSKTYSNKLTEKIQSEFNSTSVHTELIHELIHNKIKPKLKSPNMKICPPGVRFCLVKDTPVQNKTNIPQATTGTEILNPKSQVSGGNGVSSNILRRRIIRRKKIKKISKKVNKLRKQTSKSTFLKRILKTTLTGSS